MIVRFNFFWDELERVRNDNFLQDEDRLIDNLASVFCVLESIILFEYEKFLEARELASDFLFCSSSLNVKKFLLRFFSFTIMKMYKIVKAIAGKNKTIMLYDSI